MLAELCESIDRVEDLDWDKADRLIHRELTPLELGYVTGAQFTEFQPGEEFAIAMDERDPLSKFRERFLFPKTANGEDCIYLCGHSLGLQPKTAAAYIEQELEDWAELGVEGHFRAQESRGCLTTGCLPSRRRNWWERKPLEVVVMNSLTVNLHLMMVSFYRPTQAAAQDCGGTRGVSLPISTQ